MITDNQVMTPADLQREIEAENTKLNDVRAERKQLAIVAVHDRQAAAQTQKLRAEERKTSDRIEDLTLALGEVQRSEREERERLAEQLRQERERLGREKIRTLLPLAE